MQTKSENEIVMKLTTGLHTLWNMSRRYRRYLSAHVLTGAVRITLSLTFVAINKQIIDIATRQTTGKPSAWITLLVGFMVLQLLPQCLSHSIQGKTLLVITHQERTARLCQSVLHI